MGSKIKTGFRSASVVPIVLTPSAPVSPELTVEFPAGIFDPVVGIAAASALRGLHGLVAGLGEGWFVAGSLDKGLPGTRGKATTDGSVQNSSDPMSKVPQCKQI